MEKQQQHFWLVIFWKNAGYDVLVAGNIGTGFSKSIFERDYDYIVLELSSFQLDGIKDFKADIAILLNITPDHLDRYNNSFENYIKSKLRLQIIKMKRMYLSTIMMIKTSEKRVIQKQK